MVKPCKSKNTKYLKSTKAERLSRLEQIISAISKALDQNSKK